jgi:chemotaxis protein methyltransferase CheR
MKEADCVAFLQWALPRLHLQWRGFRKVHGQVCKRLKRHLHELQLSDIAAYRTYLEGHPQEWPLLDGLCRITISRFFRDRAVFTFLEQKVLPELAAHALSQSQKTLRVWSIGCASGEEPYSLALLWQLGLSTRFPDLSIRILATDTDLRLLTRARQACYPWTSLRELPSQWLDQAFTEMGGRYCLNPRYQENVIFECHDVRRSLPPESFHLILCRNLVLSYFDLDLQCTVLKGLHDILLPGGVLVVGSHEKLPADGKGFAAWSENLGVYRRCA